MDFRHKVDAFKDSCKIYESEKEHLAASMEDETLKMYMEEDVAFVEDVFSCLEKKCGRVARQALYELFVLEKTQEDVAFRMHISRRQLQYQVNGWLRTVFGETA